MALRTGPAAGRRKKDEGAADLAELRRIERWAVETTRQLMDITLDKVIAHQEEPRRHPLPADAKSPERRLHAIFDALPRRRQRQIADALKGRLEDRVRSARYGALAGVDLASKTPVLTQARAKLAAVRPKLDPAVRQRIEARLAAAPTPRGAKAPQRLVLRLDSVECRQKTLEAFEGKDELGLVARGFDEAGILAGTSAFENFLDLGKFEQGQVKPQNGRELGAFPIDPATLPKEQGFRVVLVIAELDRVLAKSLGGDVLLAYFFFLLTLAVALVIVGITGGATLVMIIWAIYVGCIPFLMQLFSLTRDDVFEIEPISATVTTGDETFDPETVIFRLGEGILKLANRRGEYHAQVRFVLE